MPVMKSRYRFPLAVEYLAAFAAVHHDRVASSSSEERTPLQIHDSFRYAVSTAALVAFSIMNS